MDSINYKIIREPVERRRRRDLPLRERIAHWQRRNLRSIGMAIALSLIVGLAIQYASVVGRIYSGLLVLQARYYMPKDQERQRDNLEKMLKRQ